MDYGCLWPADNLTRLLLKVAIHLSIIIASKALRRHCGCMSVRLGAANASAAING